MNKLTTILIVCALVACKKEEPAPTPPPEEVKVVAPTQPTTTPAAVAPEPAVDLDSLAVEEDFEEEAEKDITAANVSKKVEELEKEMSAE